MAIRPCGTSYHWTPCLTPIRPCGTSKCSAAPCANQTLRYIMTLSSPLCRSDLAVHHSTQNPTPSQAHSQSDLAVHHNMCAPSIHKQSVRANVAVNMLNFKHTQRPCYPIIMGAMHKVPCE